MNQRTVRALLVSLVVHLLAVLLLPGLGSLELTKPSPASIKVNLSTTSPEPESRTPEPEPSRTTQTAPPSPEEGNEAEESAAEVQPRPSEATEEPEPSEPSPEPEPERRDQQRDEQQPRRAETDGRAPEPSLLKRGGNFPRLASANEPPGGSPDESSLAEMPTPKYDVEVAETPTDTGSWNLKIREPSAPDEPAPRREVTFRMNLSEETEEVRMEDYVRPKADPSARRGPSRKILHRPLPEMPRWLERTGEEVRVSVHFRINTGGGVESMEILSSSGYSALDDRVLQAVRRWRYEPGEGAEDHVVLFKFELTPRGADPNSS